MKGTTVNCLFHSVYKSECRPVKLRNTWFFVHCKFNCFVGNFFYSYYATMCLLIKLNVLKIVGYCLMKTEVGRNGTYPVSNELKERIVFLANFLLLFK